MVTNVSYLASPGAFHLRSLAALLLVLVSLALAQPAAAAKVEFRFSAWDGPAVRVYASRPVHLASDRPVVFVMHGKKRNALEYRDQWHQLAVDDDFLLVVPEFDERQFPGAAAYSLGGVFDAGGGRQKPDQWSFALIEPLFDDVRKRFSMTTPGYSVYGHSAGAQFVERFLLYVPGARVSRAVVADAEWYTMPDFDQTWPHGLGGSGISEQALARMLKFPLTVLIGEADAETDDPRLAKTPEALLQAKSRLQRGSHFFEAGREAAERLGVPFGWRLQTVKGAGHDNRLMAPAAVEDLIP